MGCYAKIYELYIKFDDDNPKKVARFKKANDIAKRENLWNGMVKKTGVEKSHASNRHVRDRYEVMLESALRPIVIFDDPKLQPRFLTLMHEEWDTSDLAKKKDKTRMPSKSPSRAYSTHSIGSG